jgi:hypothetical protein
MARYFSPQDISRTVAETEAELDQREAQRAEEHRMQQITAWINDPRNEHIIDNDPMVKRLCHTKPGTGTRPTANAAYGSGTCSTTWQTSRRHQQQRPVPPVPPQDETRHPSNRCRGRPVRVFSGCNGTTTVRTNHSMAKTTKAPFSSTHRPIDSQLFTATKPVPFKRCSSCGRSVISSAEYCTECSRLIELGMRDAVKQFGYQNDTQPKQSYPAFTRSGYEGKIPDSKFPAATKERV